MQALSQTNDIEPPSYEESLYFKKIDHAIKNHNKWLPLNYDKKDILLVPKNEKQLLYYNNNNEKKLLQQQLENNNNNDIDHPFNERLERVSSCLQQMIDEAKASLTISNNNNKNNNQQQQQYYSSNDNKSSSNQKPSSSPSSSFKSNIPKRPRKKLNKRKSQQELLDSQSRIADAIEQLNSTISQHITSSSSESSSESNTPYQILEDYYYKDNDDDDSRPSSPIIYHHHYHHYHHYYYPDNDGKEKEQEIEIPKKRKRKNKLSSKSSFSLHFWTSTITETTLLFGILHYILSLSKPTSFLMSMSWLISLLLTKKKSSTRAFLNHFSFFMSQWLKRK